MRIKKVSQTTPVQAHLTNAYSESTQDGYSADYINKNVASIDSPNFTGIPTAPTAPVSKIDEQIATTSFVDSKINNDAVIKKYIGQNPDIDTYKQTGVFSLYNAAKAPETGIAVLEVLAYTPDWILQRFTKLTATPTIYVRTFTNGNTWNSWQKLH